MDSIPARLAKQAEVLGDRPALYSRIDGQWRPTSWKQYHERVLKAAKALVALGLQPGDTTAILGFNTEEWVVFDLATMMMGGACAGIYTTCSPTEVQYIVSHSEAKVVLVENAHQWGKINEERERLPEVRKVVTMVKSEAVDDPMVLTWDAFLELGADVPDATIQERMDALEPDGLATFIYTSGTTGPPKAVMLSQENIAWTATCAVEELAHLTKDDTMLSYLPLSHIAEQMFTIHAPITAGCTVSFAESLDKLPDNLKEVAPTVLFGVPRIWEKFHAKVSAKLASATGVKKMIGDWAVGVGREVSQVKMRGGSPAGFLGLKYAIADRLVYSKAKPAMGLQNARVCVTGAAPISPEILEFFSGLDLVIQEVYGQSEDCGPTSFNLAGRAKFGTVGPKLPGTEVKIAEDGEILVKGPHVFLGYYKDPEATAETLIDGWLHTGDLGEFDSEGFLKITGRKKEIIITAGGKNIAPKNIEGAIKDIDIVSQAVVIGDKRKFLSALITLAVEEDATKDFAQKHGVPVSELHAHAATREYIQQRIDDSVNPQFARVEHIRKFSILPRDFSIDANELTPTLKIKRKYVNENWSDTIEAMYQ
ncbi:MAG: AMP-binding protein [Alphaproteobacteria bacterium]|nr:AMP-binding protein [Alphaproteobacteria bacterium]MCB9690512.1 AMP-binding protein [Alphaproteobacteria bacterium]